MKKKLKITMVVGGGGDTYYELGLTSGLVSNRVNVNFIGSDSMKGKDILYNQYVKFFNLRGCQSSKVPMHNKVLRIIKYYLKLLKYSLLSDSKIFHIQWIGKFTHFDRTILNIYYKLLGKKIVFTAHNVNANIRDENDFYINRLTLRFMYKIVDHVIVHTKKMKQELIEEFKISEEKVSIIPYGINDMVHNTKLTKTQARDKLGLKSNEKIMLFFGILTPYKGLEYLLLALTKLRENNERLRLIICGKIDVSYNNYWIKIKRLIEELQLTNNIIQKIGFIPDEEVEIFFKTSDILILPYKYIYQSGILFLAYNFGLPVIATDVGSLREFIVEGKTGYVCKAKNPDDIAEKIHLYFRSDLFHNLEENRKKITKYAKDRFSWKKIGTKTYNVYKSL